MGGAPMRGSKQTRAASVMMLTSPTICPHPTLHSHTPTLVPSHAYPQRSWTSRSKSRSRTTRTRDGQGGLACPHALLWQARSVSFALGLLVCLSGLDTPPQAAPCPYTTQPPSNGQACAPTRTAAGSRFYKELVQFDCSSPHSRTYHFSSQLPNPHTTPHSRTHKN